MPCSRTTLSLSDAKRMLAAGEAEAASVVIAYNIAVVDQGWRACSNCDLAIGKALTARLFDKTTVSLGQQAQPGARLFSIEQSNGGRVIIFGGGVPVRIAIPPLRNSDGKKAFVETERIRLTLPAAEA